MGLGQVMVSVVSVFEDSLANVACCLHLGDMNVSEVSVRITFTIEFVSTVKANELMATLGYSFRSFKLCQNRNENTF